MSIDLLTYEPVGDKKNSDIFNEYRIKIYERRRSSGIEDLVGNMAAVVISIEADDAIPYLSEIYLMTPYRLEASYTSDTHSIYVLRCPAAEAASQPLLFVMEPHESSYEDEFTRFNMQYPNARVKPNGRYVGEIYRCKDIKETGKILTSHEIRFTNADDVRNDFFTNEHFAFTFMSDFTGNKVGYTASDLHDYDALKLGRKLELEPEEEATLKKVDEKFHELEFADKVLGLDHMATRILAGEREDAILEFLTMSTYYFWGAYNISAMNSSTNVTRNSNVEDDKHSPAKVFTANNTPSFVNSFEGLPMPTEDFVRNFGRRLHHWAYEVRDGDYEPEREKNVDYVVDSLMKEGIPFLNKVVGECKDVPDLKQIFSKHSQYSILITEYVERCHKFQGFFTKSNVAELTEAAGHDERYQHGNVFD
ncbi:MAG: hypothetical protein AAF591_06180 [Verrucomicrobiota bacterium]